MGDGDWWIALAMDWRTSPWMWWRCRSGCESCFLICCIEVTLSVAIYIYFFLGWGLLHGPQQGPNRMKEKNL